MLSLLFSNPDVLVGVIGLVGGAVGYWIRSRQGGPPSPPQPSPAPSPLPSLPEDILELLKVLIERRRQRQAQAALNELAQDRDPPK